MRKSIISALLLAVLLLPAEALAGAFYEHEDSIYYWYVEENPHFEIVVPATGDAYLETDLFGQKTVQIYLGKNNNRFAGPQFVVGSVTSPNVTIERIKSMALSQWGHIFTNVKTEADRRITTSNGTSAHFYAVTASTPAAKQGMLRLVIFQKGNSFAYVMLSCYASDYDSNTTLRNQWLRAVNDFRWLD